MMKSVTKEKVFHVLKLVLLAVTVTLVLLSLLGTVAHASGLVDDTVNADNLYSKYPLSNYQLDFYVDNSWSWLPWNWLDGIGKSVQYGLYCITNFVWTISLYLSNATGYVVQQAYKLDFINDMADSIGKSIQTLAGVTENGFSSSGFYVGFLLIIILIVGVYTAYTGLLKRETSKALHAVINFVVVFIVSASFIAYAPNYIQKINDFSSDISTASLDLGTKIMLPDSQSKGKDSVDLIRDSLFAIQVEKPWLLLQFGNSDTEEIGTDRVEALVSASPSDEDIEIEKENINFDFLLKTLSNTTEMLCSDIEYTIKTNCNKQQTLFINLEIIIQIYENLLSNSIRYAKSMIAIDVNKQEEFLLITVSDDGCGFKSTDIERVTLPFYKPSQDTTSEHLGLGLNICKILCERHGGTIKISNNHKGGACVTACIKIAYVDEK